MHLSTDGQQPISSDVLSVCCVALMAIIASGTFLGGTLGPTPHKIAVVMTVTVFHSVILCQYVGCTPLGCQVGLRCAFSSG